MDDDATVDLVAHVRTLTTAQVRRIFTVLRKHRDDPGIWCRYLPEAGVTVGEFSVGYVLRTRPT